MRRLSRRISPVCALLLGAFLFTGCPGGGGGGGGDGGNGGQDAGPPGDAMTDAMDDEDATGGGSCESSDDCESDSTPVCNEETGECVECVSDSDCVGQNQVCGDDNTCELEAADQCEQVGDTCTPGEPTSDGFLCVDDGLGEPTCMARCGGDFGQCPASKVCLAGEQAQGGEARSVCYPSQCEGPHDTETCQDASGHVLFGDYPNGAKCATIGGANLCVPDGSQDAGSKCNATFPSLCAAQDIPEEDCFTCSAGNVCQGGKCRTACGSEGSCSSGDNSCIGLGSDQIAGTSGFCGQECDAFSRGQCGSDQGCAPLNGETGYCGDVGDKGFMESCEPGGIANPDTRSCKEGMRCLLMQGEPGGENAIARCIPQCNPTNDSQPQNDVTCGGTAFAKFVYTSDTPSAVDVYVGDTAVVTDLQTGVSATPTAGPTVRSSPDSTSGRTSKSKLSTARTTTPTTRS